MERTEIINEVIKKCREKSQSDEVTKEILDSLITPNSFNKGIKKETIKLRDIIKINKYTHETTDLLDQINKSFRKIPRNANFIKLSYTDLWDTAIIQESIETDEDIVDRLSNDVLSRLQVLDERILSIQRLQDENEQYLKNIQINEKTIANMKKSISDISPSFQL